MAYWLMKSEPDVYSIDHLRSQKRKTDYWDGIRNYQARNFMREMAVGDLGFFYHSQGERAIVGIVEICAAAHPDSSTEDARWECVDIKAVRPFEKPVTLDDIKADGRFDDMPLVKSPRLSVQPVTAEQWSAICALGNTKP